MYFTSILLSFVAISSVIGVPLQSDTASPTTARLAERVKGAVSVSGAPSVARCGGGVWKGVRFDPANFGDWWIENATQRGLDLLKKGMTIGTIPFPTLEPPCPFVLPTQPTVHVCIRLNYTRKVPGWFQKQRAVQVCKLQR